MTEKIVELVSKATRRYEGFEFSHDLEDLNLAIVDVTEAMDEFELFVDIVTTKGLCVADDEVTLELLEEQREELSIMKSVITVVRNVFAETGCDCLET